MDRPPRKPPLPEGPAQTAGKVPPGAPADASPTTPASEEITQRISPPQKTPQKTPQQQPSGARTTTLPSPSAGPSASRTTTLPAPPSPPSSAVQTTQLPSPPVDPSRRTQTLPSPTSNADLQRTTPLPAVDRHPPGQRPGMGTEILAPPPPARTTTAAPGEQASSPQASETRRPSADTNRSAGSPAQRPPRPPSPASSGARIVARKSNEVPRPVAWLGAPLLVFAVGLALWTLQEPIAATLDRWLSLPDWRQPEPVVAAVSQPAVETPPAEPEVVEPVWTYSSIEEALQPLPQQVESLSRAGRSEQQDFVDLARRDAPEALRQSRWENWTLVWRNRTAIPREAMPPLDMCRLHAPLEATCVAVEQALTELEAIADLPDSSRATEAFDRADAVFEALRAAQEAELAAIAVAEALAAEQQAAESEEAGDLTEEILDATETEDVEVEDLLTPNG